MTDIELHVVREQLDRIENKLDGRLNKVWLSTSDVRRETGLSTSTIGRAIRKGELQVSRQTGKNMYKREWVTRWLK
jgi:hypothetical protein|tara:strand:+ start:187 stop:414 length:228 start_codon:yes stop_codon:yes gene_type:complete